MLLPRPLSAGLLSAVLALSSQAFATDPVVCIDENDFAGPPVAPAPQALNTGLPRTVYEGGTPPGLDPNRPVLVFVHGLNGSGNGWYGETNYYGRNDMYDTVYAAGYKAFIVDLYDVGAQAETSITNGSLLKSQIDFIRNYWGVSEVNVIGHSKGGPDANFAAIQGAAIDTIVSLSAPHYGSPLADLAQTDWLEWLSDLIGFNDAGTKFLQTGCMSLARSYLDRSPVNNDLHLYTVAGTGWGPFLSAQEFGGLYLYTVCPGGENDGVVCVEHARHPLSRDANGATSGQHRLVWDLSGPDYEVDHDKIRRGSGFFDFFWFWEPNDCYVPIFDSIEPYAGVFHGFGPDDPERALNAKAPSADLVATPPTAPPFNADGELSTLIRGGALEAGVTEIEFPVETDVRAMDVRVLSGRGSTRMELIAPNGDVHRLSAARASNDALFNHALVSGTRLAANAMARAAGTWRLRFTANERDAYALLARLDSPLQLALSAPKEASFNVPTEVAVSLSGQIRNVDVAARVRRTSTAGAAEEVGRFGASTAQPLALPLREPGVYNVALTITGTTIDGKPFERSRVLSYAVQDPQRPLPQACQ
ncbi:MAG: alpha/beta fold hydrolase [Pseudomonadota bacterium]